VVISLVVIFTTYAFLSDGGTEEVKDVSLPRDTCPSPKQNSATTMLPPREARCESEYLTRTILVPSHDIHPQLGKTAKLVAKSRPTAKQLAPYYLFMTLVDPEANPYIVHTPTLHRPVGIIVNYRSL